MLQLSNRVVSYLSSCQLFRPFDPWHGEAVGGRAILAMNTGANYARNREPKRDLTVSRGTFRATQRSLVQGWAKKRGPRLCYYELL